MKKIVAFGASNSKASINRQFAAYAAACVENATVNLLDLNDYEMPIYSIDRENENGVHPLAFKFRKQLDAADGIIISFAEYNGAYTSAFKNIFEWISRGGPNIWGNKPMLLLATAPGPRGGKSVLEIAVGKLSRMTEAEIVHFSLPEFGKNFNSEICDADLNAAFQKVMNKFSAKLK